MRALNRWRALSVLPFVLTPPSVSSIQAVVEHFNTVPCKGRPLFKPEFCVVLRNLLIHVDNGCLSDPEGVPLYEQVPGAFWCDLPVLHCLRGTPGVEGVFLQSNDVPTGKNTGVLLADAMLCLHAYNRNLVERARRRGVNEPAHRQLWRDSRLDAARKRHGLPAVVHAGINVCPPATDETFGGQHLLPDADATSAIDALASDGGSEEEASILVRRLRLRFFGRADPDAATDVMAPSWASRRAAPALSAPAPVAAPVLALATPAPSQTVDSCSLPSLPFTAPSHAPAPAASQPRLSAGTPFQLQPQRFSLESTPPSTTAPVFTLTPTQPRSALPAAPAPARAAQVVESALPHLPEALEPVVAAMVDPAISGGGASGGARFSCSNSPRARRAALLMRDFSTPVETLEEHALFLAVLGDNRAPCTQEDWMTFTCTYNARVSAALQQLPVGVDPVLRPKRIDALRTHSAALAERLRRARGAAPNAVAAPANEALLRRLVASAANVQHAPISTPSAVVAPPPAAAAARLWRPPMTTAVPAGGRNAPRLKGCCGHQSDSHPRERERCPFQNDIKPGFPTEGPLPGGRYCYKSEARRNAAKRPRLN